MTTTPKKAPTASECLRLIRFNLVGSGALVEGSPIHKHVNVEIDALLKDVERAEAEAAQEPGDSVEADDVKWIVNDLGELGVEVRGRCFFLYKGYSLEYEDGQHDDGSPVLYRAVGKREFGEVCYPAHWNQHRPRELGGWYTRELTPGVEIGRTNTEVTADGRWRPLPSYKPAAPDATWLDTATFEEMEPWLPDDIAIISGTRSSVPGFWVRRTFEAQFSGVFAPTRTEAVRAYLKANHDLWSNRK